MDVIVTENGTELECDAQRLSVSKKINLATKKVTGYLVYDSFRDYPLDIDEATYNALLEYGCDEK